MIHGLGITVAATLAGAVMMLAQFAQWIPVFGHTDDEDHPGVLGLLVAVLVAPLAATLIQLAISRAREYEADATAAGLTGSPQGLIGALQALERGTALIPSTTARPATAHLSIANPLSGVTGVMGRHFSTHPPIDECIAALRALASTRPVSRVAVGQ